MYQDHYGFIEKPFHITPNPRFIYLSRSHREVFAHLLYGIRNRSGFIEVTGEVGTGKTTVLRALLNHLEEEAYRSAFIFNPSLSAPELLRSIHREFGLDTSGNSDDALLQGLNDFLLEEHRRGRTVVLVIDEAQNLKAEVLEQIRLLSNLETESEKLIQIVLVGQPELGQILSRKELRQLNQRISVRYHLEEMGQEDTRSYIRHRLEVAGARGRELFTPAAERQVFRFSGGVPRLINLVCDRALLVGYAEGAATVTPALVRTAIREVRRQTGQGQSRARSWGAAAALGLLGLAGGGLLASHQIFPTAGPAPNPRQAPIAATAVLRGHQDPDPVPTASPLPRSAGEGALLNQLLGLWGEEPLEDAGKEPGQWQLGVALRGLTLTPFTGDWQNLVALDSPALLRLENEGQESLVLLNGLTGDQGRLTDRTGERRSLSVELIGEKWSGKAWLVWKNFLGLPDLLQEGSRGPEVSLLQELLRRLELRSLPSDGIYDRATADEVATLQGRRGITRDGRVGPQTLIVLYQESGRFQVPRLQAVTARKGGP